MLPRLMLFRSSCGSLIRRVGPCLPRFIRGTSDSIWEHFFCRLRDTVRGSAQIDYACRRCQSFSRRRTTGGEVKRCDTAAEPSVMDEQQEREVARGLRKRRGRRLASALRRLRRARLAGRRAPHGAELRGRGRRGAGDLPGRRAFGRRLRPARAARCGCGCGASPAVTSLFTTARRNATIACGQPATETAESPATVGSPLPPTDTASRLPKFWPPPNWPPSSAPHFTELPAEYETVLTARYLDGESVEHIANLERSTVTAVRSRLARARQAFRQILLRYSVFAGETRDHHESDGRRTG